MYLGDGRRGKKGKRVGRGGEGVSLIELGGKQ